MSTWDARDIRLWARRSVGIDDADARKLQSAGIDGPRFVMLTKELLQPLGLTASSVEKLVKVIPSVRYRSMFVAVAVAVVR